MRGLAAALLMMVLALAGCATQSDTPDATPTATKTASSTASAGPSGTSTSKTGTSTTTATSTASATATGTGTKGPTANTPPTAVLGANRTTGSPPLAVTFALNGTDADGDALTYTLSFGDGTAPANGTRLPGTVAHNYTAAGNYTARLTVSDGKGSANATVTVTAGSAPAPAGFTPIAAELDVLILCELCTDGASPALCLSLNLGVPGADCAWVELPAAAVGHTFTIEGVSPTLGADPDWALTAACSATGEVLAMSAGDSSSTETGEVVAGSACLVIWDFYGAGPVTFKVAVA